VVEAVAGMTMIGEDRNHPLIEVNLARDLDPPTAQGAPGIDAKTSLPLSRPGDREKTMIEKGTLSVDPPAKIHLVMPGKPSREAGILLGDSGVVALDRLRWTSMKQRLKR